jgi:hypothetical protein
MIEKLQKESMQLKEELITQSTQLARNKSASGKRNIINTADEIKRIKEQIENEKLMWIKMDSDVKTLQKEMLD